jgi:ferric-dicitrate binding protein FerR (iron transport regulator)
VRLSGEAYFEVAREASLPFRVECSGSVVEVLGTSFNVRAYEDEGETRATLVEGSVRFYASGRGVVLRAGEQGVVSRDGRPWKREVDVELYTGWKDGFFAFDRGRLEDVMRDIARWYKIEVVFEEPELGDISFSGVVRRYEEFNTVVRMLEMTGDTRFSVEGNVVTIHR